MSTLKRFTASIMSSFESILGKIENHEALASSAIREGEQAAGRAKAQFARVQKDGIAIKARLDDLRAQSRQWEDRAKGCAKVDEQKALECIRRREKLRKRIVETQTQAEEHSKLERQLAADLVAIQEKLAHLRQQRNVLRTKQSRAEALRLVDGVDSATIGEIDDIFNRWELKIGACEEHSHGTYGDSDDSLTSEFESAEEEAQIRALLGELIDK
jgi:phage shock protein A